MANKIFCPPQTVCPWLPGAMGADPRQVCPASGLPQGETVSSMIQNILNYITTHFFPRPRGTGSDLFQLYGGGFNKLIPNYDAYEAQGITQIVVMPHGASAPATPADKVRIADVRNVYVGKVVLYAERRSQCRHYF